MQSSIVAVALKPEPSSKPQSIMLDNGGKAG
jgi:hypothetical protein